MQNDNRHIAIIGSGGHADVVTEAALLQFPKQKITVFCNYSNGRQSIFGIPILNYSSLIAVLEKNQVTNFIIAVGQIEYRRNFIVELEKSSVQPISIFHRSAVVSASAKVGRGVYCGPMSVIHSGAHVCDNSIVNSMALVEHGCVVGANSHLAPRASLLGNAKTGQDVFIGSNATVFPRTNVTSNTIVGANSLVNKSITEPGTYFGTPLAKKNV
ncbi:NeuD/PglB/VioB family sugar acetyltransferase [Alteromonas macleodii]|uniref:NeuD/PglB/VioB family sugar acetyltransferase n=1 Tax=Alteromonas macleodii TaxID=28108 RepID=UPI00313D2121